jgi:two-component system sensor histidine kinase TctE
MLLRLRRILATRHEQRSLFGEILDWLLVPLLLLWPLSVALTWYVAQGVSNRPYDRELGDLARSVAAQAVVEAQRPARPAVEMRSALTRTVSLLRGADEDRLAYQVLGPRGEWLAGETALPVPESLPLPGEVRFRDDELRGEPVRVATLRVAATEGPPRVLVVQLAETLGKRSAHAAEIIKGVILPQFVILPLVVLLVWLALERGIRPLASLQARIRRRSGTDLSPIDVRDVPEEVAPLVAAINELLRRLERSLQVERQFIADAAHQLKTPLAGLRTQAELAAREIDRGLTDPASTQQTLRHIALASQRLAHLVDQLLALARAETEGQSFVREPVDLALLAQSVLPDFVPQAIERRIDLGYEGEGDEAARVAGHAVLLGELLRNLVDNALAYTPAGGHVTVRVESVETRVRLVVEDTGPGIPPAQRELVFRAFWRPLGTGVEGSGLGLAIVQAIAERHEAHITVAETHPRPAAGQPSGQPSGLPTGEPTGGPTGQGPGARFTVSFPRLPQRRAGDRGAGADPSAGHQAAAARDRHQDAEREPERDHRRPAVADER